MHGAEVQQSGNDGVRVSRTVGKRVSAALAELMWVAAFIVAYFLPLVMELTDALIQDQRVAALIDDLLATPTARIEIARNMLGHLLPLLLVYWLTCRLASGLASQLRIAGAVARIAMLLLAWMLLLSGNALLYPRSSYSVVFTMLTTPLVTWSLVALFVCAAGWLALRTWGRRHYLVAGSAAAALCAAYVVISPVRGAAPTGGRNVIIIGVDSLSADTWNRVGGRLPHLNGLMQASTRYTRAYTPLARTFPAWMSILSGKPPAETGGIFNLRDLDQVEKRDLLSTDMQQRGYRTVYAIDERRFNNMDQSFGFDRLVGPEAGALDFVIQRLNDMPLSNLLLQTSAGRALMPFSYINTASYVSYDAGAFVDQVLDATAGAPKVFLAAHFESAHFPFKTRHAEHRFDTPNAFWNEHAAALTVVDRQVGQLMDGLSAQGHLQDALVIVLSDHGEGFGESEGWVMKGGLPVDVHGYGHGVSVLSDAQNRIVLGTVEFRNGTPVGRPGTVDQQVSLLDIRRTVSSFVESGVSRIQAAEPCMIVETGVRTPQTMDYKTLDEATMAATLADFYEIEALGRMQIRESRLVELVNEKDIGVRCADHLTWWTRESGSYFSLRLDDKGGYSLEQDPPATDIARIEAYRQRMITNLNSYGGGPASDHTHL